MSGLVLCTVPENKWFFFITKKNCATKPFNCTVLWLFLSFKFNQYNGDLLLLLEASSFQVARRSGFSPSQSAFVPQLDIFLLIKKYPKIPSSAFTCSTRIVCERSDLGHLVPRHSTSPVIVIRRIAFIRLPGDTTTGASRTLSVSV